MISPERAEQVRAAVRRYYQKNRERILEANRLARQKARLASGTPAYDRSGAMKRLWQTRSPASRAAALAGLFPGNRGNTGRRSEAGKVVSRMDAIAMMDPEIRRGRS